MYIVQKHLFIIILNSNSMKIKSDKYEYIFRVNGELLRK